MATRKDIRVAFYDELETAAPSETNITQESPNTVEVFPTIAHTYRTRPDPINRGVAPTSVTTDTDGEQTYTRSETREIQFTATVVSDSDMEKEDVYETLKGYFGGYEKNIKDYTDLHPDIYQIRVSDSNPNNMTDRTPRVYGDSLTISLFFERYYEEDVDPTTGVSFGVDADGDGTIDETYTTT